MTPAEVQSTFRYMEECFVALEQAPMPVLAAVEGVAAGAGCQLALSADILVMADSARIGMPVARLAILASTAFIARVSRRAGKAVTADMYLTGRLLSAEEARNSGLAARVVPSGTAVEAATAVANQVIASAPRSALAAAKRALAQVEPTQVTGVADPAAVAPSTVDREPFIAAIRRFLPSRRST